MNDTTIKTIDSAGATGHWMDSVVLGADVEVRVDSTDVMDSLVQANEAIDQLDAESAEGMAALNLMLKVMLILVAGVVIWRIMIVFNKKNAKPQGGSYFKRKYSDKWKNR